MLTNLAFLSGKTSGKAFLIGSVHIRQNEREKTKDF